MNVIQTIDQHLKALLQKEFSLTDNLLASIDTTLNTDAHKQQFGDISSNCALVLSKELGMPPIKIAQTLQETLKHPFIKQIDIAGPGFLNIFLTGHAYTTLAQELFNEGARFFATQPAPHKSYNIEFVSANPTGPLHIGHGRGGIIGDMLARIFTFLGSKVTKEFYINDAGSQMQKLGTSLKIRCQQAAGMQAELPEDGYQGQYLQVLAQECFTTYGTELFTKPNSFFIDYAKEHMLAQQEETLKKYRITYDEWFSELTLHTSNAIEKALNRLNETGFLYEKDDALWFRSTDFGDDKDRVVKKKSGELTYVAADIAYTLNKLERGFEQLILILGQDHHSYVIRLKAVMQAFGYNPDRYDIILYQLVTIKEGGQAMRLSKRAGRMITLDDIIDTVGADVARFFYLHKKADTHLDFDMKLALKHTEENPVYYIQYAYVRTKSIMTKASAHEEFKDISAADCAALGDAEQLLLKKITSLKHLLDSMARNYQTHLLAYYVIELAQTFHNYYSHHKVIDPEQPEQSRGRLLLVLLVQSTLKTCFDLLGISAPEKM